MPDLRELEERLAQCRTVIGNVLQDLNYIQKEIDSIKKAGDPAQNTLPDIDRRQGAFQGNRQGAFQGNQQGAWTDQDQAAASSYTGTTHSGLQKGLYGGAWERFDSDSRQSMPAAAGSVVHDSRQSMPAASGSVVHNSRQSMPETSGSVVHDSRQSMPAAAGSAVHDSRQSMPAATGSVVHDSRQSMPAATGSVVQQPEASYVYSDPEKKGRSSESAESIFGKKVMAVTASVLIFISLILFAALIIPALSDGAKFALMLIVSFGITSFGLIKWFRNKESVFFISVGACGVGSIYISLFLSNIYFKIIGNVMLFILLLVWAGGVLFLSRYKKLLFELIGNIGITISVIFGSAVCTRTYDLNMMILLSCYFFIGTLAFMIYRRKDNVSYIITNSNAVISMMSLVISSVTLIKDRRGMVNLAATDVRIILFLLLGLFCLVMIVYNILSSDRTNREWMGFFGAGYFFLLAGVLYGIFTDSRWRDLTGLALCTILYIGVELYTRKKQESVKGAGTYCLQLCLIAAAIIYSCGFRKLETAGVFFAFSAALTIFGFAVNDIFSKIMGLALDAMLLIAASSHPVPVLLMFIGLFALVNVLMFIKNSQYNAAVKISSYLLFLLQLAVAVFFLEENDLISSKMAGLTILVVIGLLNIIALKTKYVNNWEIKEADPASQNTCNIVNAVMMMVALVEIAVRNDEPGHWIAVLMGILLFMLNSYRLIKKGGTWPAVYVGLKTTILLITILCSFSAGGAVLSISVFVLSIVLIVLGFRFKAKGLRIYGLVISLVCAIKLVMIDITYENTFGHAISFFISGILCFAISAIYSYVEKKYK